MPSDHVKRGFLKWLTRGLLVFVLTFLSVYTADVKPEQRHADITETRIALLTSARRTVPYRISLDHIGLHHIIRYATYTHVAELLCYENKIRERHRVTEQGHSQMTPRIVLLPVVYSAETPDPLPAFLQAVRA